MRAHPDLNQGPADLQSAALTTELCTRMPCARGTPKTTPRGTPRAPQGGSQEVSQSVAKGVPQGAPQDTSVSQPGWCQPSWKNQAPRSIPNGLPRNTPRDTPRGIPRGTSRYLPLSASLARTSQAGRTRPQRVLQRIAQGGSQEVLQGVTQGVHQEVPQGTSVSQPGWKN